MNDEWEQYLKDNPHQGCDLKAFYDKDTDSITKLFNDEPAYGEYIDEELVIFKSTKTHEVVGFEINGVTKITKQ